MAKYIVKKGSMHERFRNGRKKIQIIGGGFGNGKTAAACVRAIELAHMYPGSNGLIAMATYAQLNDTIREEFYKWVPASSVKRWPTVSDNTLVFNNGSKVNFRYIKQKGKAAAADGQTSSNLLSATFDWAIVDQIENPEITYKDYLDLLGRLRGTTQYKGTDATMPETGPRWLILTANPSFNWVYHKIIKPYNHYKETGQIHPDMPVDENNEPLIEIFEASTYENAHNLPSDFIATMEATYKGQFRDRYIGGEWGAFEGLVYPNFSREHHMLPRSEILQYVYQLGYRSLKPIALEGFDFGIAVPSAYLFGFVDYMGRPFIIDGFYQAGMSVQQIADEIQHIQFKYSAIVDISNSINADPAIFRRSVVDGYGKGADTIASILRERGLSVKPGQNAILSGIAKVAGYLAVDNIPHFMTQAPGGRAIYFARELTWLADEFASYFWKMGTGFERIDEPIDKNDHGMDTIKYMLSYLPDAKDILYNSLPFALGVPKWGNLMNNR